MTDFTYTDGVAATGGTGESSLSVGFPDLKSEVGFFLGYGRSTWTEARESTIEDLVQSGIRLVYYPPAISDESIGHEWSWLRPSTTLSVVKPYATGTVTIVAGVVTLSVAGTFPTWAAGGELTIDAGTYTVASYDGANQITLDDTTVDADALSTYSLTRMAYDLPDDFNRLVGMLHFPSNEYRTSVQLVSISRLLQLRASRSYESTPQWCATRYKTSTGATGQRQEILLYPSPDQDWSMGYEYEAYSGVLSDDYPYPLGGMHLAELYTESCLAAAERRINQEEGLHNEQYKRLLADAIERDKGRTGRNFGQMGHRDSQQVEFRRGWTGGTYPITYNGGDL